MKKIGFSFMLVSFSLFMVANCSSVQKTRVGNQQVVTVQKVGIGFFSQGGAPTSACLEMLDQEGVSEVLPPSYVTPSYGFTGLLFGGPAVLLAAFSRNFSTFTEGCNAEGVIQ